MCKKIGVVAEFFIAKTGEVLYTSDGNEA